MLLAIDIGNSNIVIGGIDEEKIHFEARIATDRIKTSDQYGVEIKNMLDLFRVPVEEVEDCIISSVVPPVFNAVRTGVVKVTGMEPIVVGPGIKTGLNIQMDDPASVGSDRIVIAVAALQEYKPPSSWWIWGRPLPWRWWTTGTPIWAAASSRGPGVGGGSVQPGLPAAGHPAGQAQAGHWEEYCGVYAQWDHVWGCRHAGRDAGPDGGGTGEKDHGRGDRWDGAVHRPLCRRKMMVEKDLLLKGLYAIYKKNKK